MNALNTMTEQAATHLAFCYGVFLSLPDDEKNAIADRRGGHIGVVEDLIFLVERIEKLDQKHLAETPDRVDDGVFAYEVVEELARTFFQNDGISDDEIEAAISDWYRGEEQTAPTFDAIHSELAARLNDLENAIQAVCTYNGATNEAEVQRAFSELLDELTRLGIGTTAPTTRQTHH